VCETAHPEQTPRTVKKDLNGTEKFTHTNQHTNKLHARQTDTQNIKQNKTKHVCSVQTQTGIEGKKQHRKHTNKGQSSSCTYQPLKGREERSGGNRSQEAERLKTFAVNDLWTRFIIFLFRDPHLLKC